MIDYQELNEDVKRKFRELFAVDRVHSYFLEDNKIFIMNSIEMFEFLYIEEIIKVKDAIELIKKIINYKIFDKDVNNTICQKILNENKKIYQISEDIFVYSEHKPRGIVD